MSGNGQATPPYKIHNVARCCWCKSFLILIGKHYWCQREECRAIQRRYAVCFEQESEEGLADEWFTVPLPLQAHVEMQTAPNVMFAGAAGPGKSFWGRRRLLRRAIAYPGYRGLIIRRQLTELQATHLSYIEAELETLKRHGIAYKLKPKYVEFPELDSRIDFGHLSDKRSLASCLSIERDDILADECSTIDPKFLPELFSRARTSNPHVLADNGAKALVVTNPGGPASAFLKDCFISHTPDYERAPQLRDKYKAADWIYIEATLESNPYLDEKYGDTRLAMLDSVRYEQLRHANWDIFEGQMFPQWQSEKNGAGWHVQDVTLV